jgi:hypothetical protein
MLNSRSNLLKRIFNSVFRQVCFEATVIRDIHKGLYDLHKPFFAGHTSKMGQKDCFVKFQHRAGICVFVVFFATLWLSMPAFYKHNFS